MTRFALLSVALAACPGSLRAEWKQLPPLPDKEGFAGPFAGVSGGALLVAGGANFPDKKPWEGGAKVWHDGAFVLEKPGGAWKTAGKLSRPLAYGVCATHRGGVVCAGGSDATRHYADCFRLEWKAGKLVTTKLPALPKPVANACGALVGDTLYVAGGQDEPGAAAALRTVYTLDLGGAKAEWREEKPLPGSGRVLAVAASFGGKFWIAGGAELVAGEDGAVARRYLKDVACYEPAKGWTRCAPLPRAAAGAPSPAPSDERGFYVLGGDDGSQLDTAPARHRGFSKQVLRFDGKKNEWAEAGELAAPRVTVPLVAWNGAWVVPCGEVRPGVRSPQVWAFAPK